MKIFYSLTSWRYTEYHRVGNVSWCTSFVRGPKQSCVPSVPYFVRRFVDACLLHTRRVLYLCNRARQSYSPRASRGNCMLVLMGSSLDMVRVFSLIEFFWGSQKSFRKKNYFLHFFFLKKVFKKIFFYFVFCERNFLWKIVYVYINQTKRRALSRRHV